MRPKRAFSILVPMPLPLIPLAIGALIGRGTKKTKKVKAVSGYKTKTGKKVKAYVKTAK